MLGLQDVLLCSGIKSWLSYHCIACQGISSVKTWPSQINQTWRQTIPHPLLRCHINIPAHRDRRCNNLRATRWREGQVINLHTSPSFSSHLIYLSGALGPVIVVSNKRLTHWLCLASKLIYPGCAIHSASEAHVSFKWNVGSYVGQGSGNRREAVKGPRGFVSAGEPFKHWFSVTHGAFCDWGHLMRCISVVIRDIKRVGDSQKGPLLITSLQH